MKDIFSFIKAEEAAYALPIQIEDGWDWSMKKHIRLSTLYKNSQFSVGNTEKERDEKPFKNIVRPILNLQYRSEGFDVKDIVLYIDDTEEYFKSFLAKKYHDRFARREDLDTFIDEIVESYVDYGGTLLKDIKSKRPEVQPLQSIAFCDQSNMLGGPIAFKHFYSPDQLQEFAALGWGDEKNGADITIEEAIVLAGEYKVPDSQNGQQVKTPGKYIEVYEVHGTMKDSWLRANGNPDKYVRQMQIVLFYKDEQGSEQGVKLFAGREKPGVFKVLLRDKIHGRALGFGGVEELFDSQVWTNAGEIRIESMLNAAAKILHKTTDQSFKTKNKLNDLEQNEILVIEEGRDIAQLDTQPRNIALFERSVNEWEKSAQQIGAATDALLGESPASGTPFALQNLITTQGLGLHEHRRGKIATFTGIVWTDWILPKIQQEMCEGKTFLEELSLDELQQVAEAIVECQANDYVKEKILNGEPIFPADVEAAKVRVRQQFMKKGSKHFLDIFKEEMKDLPISVYFNVAGKQKDLNKITDKLVNIFRQIIANPAILDDPRMAKLFNQIIEASGLSPIDFGMYLPKPTPAAPVVPTPPVPVA